MSAADDVGLMRAAITEIRHDYQMRAEVGDQHALFHLEVANWIEAHANDLDATQWIGSTDSPGDVWAAIDVAKAWLGPNATRTQPAPHLAGREDEGAGA